jgi:type IV pilus assembly protein PilX
MKPVHRHSPSARRQQGAALIMGLIFIVVLTVLGVTAARMAGLEERMAGNMRDRALAMQAAELALRDAERDILGIGAFPRNPPISGISGFAANCDNDLATTNTIEDNGLCYNGTAGYATPVWTTISMTAAPSVPYGLFTTRTSAGGTSPATTIPLVNSQPRYIIEGFRKVSGGSDAFYYRITVRAVGANPNTVVWLQEVFKP